MVRPVAHRLLDLAVDAELDHDPVQGHRDDDRLEDERDAGGDEEVRRLLDPGLPGDAHGQQQGVDA